MRNFIFALLTILTITSCQKELPVIYPDNSGVVIDKYFDIEVNEQYIDTIYYVSVKNHNTNNIVITTVWRTETYIEMQNQNPSSASRDAYNQIQIGQTELLYTIQPDWTILPYIW